jgi:hypothetical protein
VIFTQVEPTPTPTITVVPVENNDALDLLLGISPSGATVIGLAVLLILGSALLITWAILRSAKLPPPTALITSLALLSLFAIAGGITTKTEAAWTIAAAGVGALAASVTSMFQNTRYDPSQTVEKAVAVVQEIERQEQAQTTQSFTPPIISDDTAEAPQWPQDNR